MIQLHEQQVRCLEDLPSLPHSGDRIYVPKQGAPASETAWTHKHFSNGHGAGREPGEDYDGEGRCRDPQEYGKQWSVAQEKIAKAKPAAGGYPKTAPTSPSRSATSCEQIPSPQSKEKSKNMDVWELLSKEERQQIFQRVQSRLPPAPQSDVELEPDYAAQ